MSPSLIAVTGVIYLVVAVDLWAHGKGGLAIAYLGYAAANARDHQRRGDDDD